MKNASTRMYMLTEKSPFMMGFVIITKENNAIVVDGGRPEDIPTIKEYVGERNIAAWFLTHAHDDHITALITLLQTDDEMVSRIERIYYNMPTMAFIGKYEHYELHTRRDFCLMEQKYPEKMAVPRMGDKIRVDEVEFEILMTYSTHLWTNAVNDSSMVFRMTTESTSVLFLGDIGPEGGDELLRLQYGNLKADYVQMAHHGHMCCGPEVYMEIAPRACLWCSPDWLYDEPDYFIRERMYGQGATRKWMRMMGITEHYVTKDGTQEFIL